MYTTKPYYADKQGAIRMESHANTSGNPHANRVGQRIREIRERHKLSIEELANASKTRPALIERLEAGDLVPSLAPLMAIARALGVRLGSFLDDQATTDPVVHRAGHSAGGEHFTGSNLGENRAELDFHALAANKNDRHMEPFLITVEPPAGAPVLSSHEGEEFIYVLSGGIEVVYGKDAFRLGAGDSIYYDSIVPHHLHGGEKGATILAVIYTPI